MDVAFAGCGAVAERYAAGLPAFDDLRLVAVADLDGDRAARFADDRDCRAYADVGTMLRESAPDLVVNLTGHRAHAAVTRECLEAGVHAYSEKPLALDADEARDLVSLATSRGLGLGCAPRNDRGEQQRLAARLLADGRLGDVGVVTATAHVGRVTEWHDRPESFLAVGPLYDGAVYPLTPLVEWFGPVERVRTADALTRYPEREGGDPERPTHVEATLDLRDGPFVRLTASTYVPHRAREFFGVELHGDDGSLYVSDVGDHGGGREHLVAFGRTGRDYTPVPLQHPPRAVPYLAGVADLAERVRRGASAVDGARRAAHVVAACNAVERAAETGEPVAVDDCGFAPRAPPAPRPHLAPERDRHGAAVLLPPVGFGCSRYRDGEYVDRAESVATALDAGYRFLDSAELYGNESRIGDLLAAPGAPARESLFLVSKVWNTNHGHVREAFESTREALGVETLDCYMLHWPEAWRYTGPLRDLASLPVEEREARTFPRDDDGEIVRSDVSLEAAWRGLEALYDDGLVRTLGVCNVDCGTLREVLSFARVPPAVVQVERHPYLPRENLVEFCHGRGIRVVAHSPLSAPGLLEEPALAEVAAARDATPAQVVLAWNVDCGVVPIPASTTPDHVVENAAAAGIRLDPEDAARIEDLADPEFER